MNQPIMAVENLNSSIQGSGERALSERDLELIHALQIAPRIPWAAAGEILGAHPAALSKRWTALQGRGAAWIAVELTTAARDQLLSFTQLGCLPESQAAITVELQALRHVISLDMLSQRHDLGLTLVASGMDEMANEIFEQLTAIEGVRSLESNFCVHMHRSAREWTLRTLDRQQVAAFKALDQEQTATDPSIVIRQEHRPVIEQLQRDPRSSVADIARTAGLSQTTARRQLARVLHSDVLSLRCDMAQPLSGYPVTAQWFTRLPAAQHHAAASALASMPNIRMVASTTGQANLMVAMWLRSVNDVLDAERVLGQKVPGLEVLHNSLLVRPSKRLGWLLQDDGRATGEYVPPPFALH